MKDQLEAPVRHCMAPGVRTLSDHLSLVDAALELEQLGMSAMPVLDHRGSLVGALGWSELRCAAKLLSRAEEPRGRLRLPQGRVGQFMSSRVPVVGRDTSISAAARRMHERGLKRLYVAADGPLEGVLSTRELLQVVLDAALSLPLGKLARRAVATIDAGEPLATATALWSAEPQHGGRRFAEPAPDAHCNACPLNIVVTRQGQPVGVLTPEAAELTREANPREAVEGWMDDSLLSLPADLPASAGARLLLEQNRRYIVTPGTGGGLGLLSGLDFAWLIAQGAGAPDAIV